MSRICAGVGVHYHDPDPDGNAVSPFQMKPCRLGMLSIQSLWSVLMLLRLPIWLETGVLNKKRRRGSSGARFRIKVGGKVNGRKGRVRS